MIQVGVLWSFGGGVGGLGGGVGGGLGGGMFLEALLRQNQPEAL